MKLQLISIFLPMVASEIYEGNATQDVMYSATGYGYSISSMAATVMIFLTLFCGCFLAFSSPDKAAKAFGITKDTSKLDGNSKFMLQAIGFMNLSTATTVLLILYGSPFFSIWQCVALGYLPRFVVLIRYYLGSNVNDDSFTLVLHGFVPLYGILLALVDSGSMLSDTTLIELFDPQMEPATATRAMGYMYVVGGIFLMLAPVQFGKLMNYKVHDDAFGKGLLRGGAGKSDIVEGALLIGLGMGFPIDKALGLANVGWLFSILVSDLCFQTYITMGKSLKTVVIQLCFGIAGSTALYPSY